MKELKIKTVHNAEYDITINCFLSSEQIEEIAKEVIKLPSYVEREQMICYKVLSLCTDISVDTIENTDPNLIEMSGLWEVVKNCIFNFYEIEDAIKFYESVVRLLADIAEIMPNLVSQLHNIDLKEIVKNGVQ